MSLRWWAVYRGWQYLESVRAVSGERALDVVSEREGIPLAELDAVDHGTMERPGLGLLPMFSQELGPEFSEPGPTMQSVPWAQTEARLEAERETGPIPDAGPTDADLLGEVV